MLESSEKPAVLLSRDYRILAVNEAYRKHYEASPELGHDRCFAVSHGYDSPCDENGESCPLRNSLSSKRNERLVHIHHGPDGAEYVDVELRPLLDEGGEIPERIVRGLEAALARALAEVVEEAGG